MIHTLQRASKGAIFLRGVNWISLKVPFVSKCTHNIEKKMFKSKVIIDTDPGIDDTVAIALALASPNVDVMAITCISGNVYVDQACRNTYKILDVFGRKDVPVYRGNEKSFVGGEEDATYFHGIDGLGDVVQHIPYPEGQPASNTHASLAIIDLAKKYPGEITLAAIGPLTNLAIAYHLCPKLPSLLKKVTILGGNYQALGNVTPTAEFNFYADPEAAAVVLEQFSCPKWLVPWELNFEQKLYSAFWKEYASQGNKRSEFVGKMVLSKINADDPQSFFHISDAFATALAADPSIIVEKKDFWATVETAGHHTRGMTVVDRRLNAPERDNLTTFVTKIDLEKIRKMILASVS